MPKGGQIQIVRIPLLLKDAGGGSVTLNISQQEASERECEVVRGKGTSAYYKAGEALLRFSREGAFRWGAQLFIDG